MLREDQAVQHERIQRIERAVDDDMFVRVGVAIGDPALAIGADAEESVVFAAAPDRIGIQQPERRRIRAGGEIHIKIAAFASEAP